MVIRLIAVPDSLDLTDFDDIFHVVLGWNAGIGDAFQTPRARSTRASVLSEIQAAATGGAAREQSGPTRDLLTLSNSYPPDHFLPATPL
jgi:hypothetical protein